jgi:hypothetical protein
MTAQIVQNDGSGPVIGTLVQTHDKVNVAVTFSNFDDTGVLGWKWEVIDAPAPSPTLNPLPADVFTATTIITPDVKGHSIRVRLTTYADVLRTVIDDADEVILGVRFAPPFDWLIPAAGETLQVDDIRGWATEVNRQLRETHAFIEGQRDSKESVRLATDGALADTYVRSGDVILMDTMQALENIDGVAPALGNRILLKDGVSDVDNGIYRVTVLGDGGTQAELTRTEDFNSDAEVTSGALVPVGPEGTNNQNKLFAVSSPDPIQVNFDPITFSGAGGGEHGSLAGLGDDDHTQYQLRSEEDAANGYAGLDGSTLLNPAHVPDGADATAIHDDTAAEIAAVAAKTAPADADLLLIEDSAAANVKKRVPAINAALLPQRSTGNVSDSAIGAQNDWLPGGVLADFRATPYVELEPSSLLTINGMQHDAANGAMEPFKFFSNETDEVDIVINHESSSAAAPDKRFDAPGGVPFLLKPKQRALFYYVRGISRWKIFAPQVEDSAGILGVQHWYVSPALGSDSSDGRADTTPLETLTELERRMPAIQTNPIAVHMRAEDYPAARWRKRLMRAGVYFIADEAWDPAVETIVVASDAAEGGTTNAAIEATGATVVPGDTIEFLDGLAAGQRRVVADYTGTTITPVLPFDVGAAPVATDNFKVTRWNTCRMVFSTSAFQSETVFAGGDARDGDGSNADEAPFTGYAFKGVGLRCSNLFARPTFKDGTYAFFGMEKTWGGAVAGNDGWLPQFVNASVSFGSTASLGAPRFIEDAPFSESRAQNWFGWGAQQDASDRAAFATPTDDTRLTLTGRWSYLDTGGPGRRKSFIRAVGRFEPPAGLAKCPLNVRGPIEIHVGRFGSQSFGVIDGATALIGVDIAALSMSSQSFLRLENLDVAADSGDILQVEGPALVSIDATVTGESASGKAVYAKFGAYIVVEGGAPALGRAAVDTDWDVGNGSPRDKTWFGAVGDSLNNASDRTTIVRRS